MPAMSDDERDAFLQERRIGVLAIGREQRAALVAPIWYQYAPGGPIEICMGGSTPKARRLRAEGRASFCVHDDGRPYRYVTAEGPVTVTPLGQAAREAIEAMASRYLGAAAGRRYAEAFSTPDEVIVRLTPEWWHTEVLG
jgi:PPOX class probable F420-dependent enzyme